jgi:hypothetical protein
VENDIASLAVFSLSFDVSTFGRLDVSTFGRLDVMTSGCFDLSLTCNSTPILQAAEEEQQVALPEVAPDNKEEEGQEKVAAENNATGDKEGQVLEEWVKHLELVVNGRSRISRRHPTKNRLLEHLQWMHVAGMLCWSC